MSPAASATASVFPKPLDYPLARRDSSVVDDYFGVNVPDPYRWLEDPDSEETKEFVQNQVKLTDSILQQCDLRDKLKDKITQLFDYPRYYAPFKRCHNYFYFFNSGLQPQTVLYVQDNLDAKAEVLLDPNQLSDDGTVALSTYSVSEDAKYLAYGLSSSGSDWVTIKVMRIQDRKVEPDTLSWVKFSGITWTHDNKGFFYNRYPPPKEGQTSDAGTETDSNLNQELYYHFLGTDQSEDILCWKDPENPKHFFGSDVTDDGKYLLLYTTESCEVVNKVYYLDLTLLSNGLESFRGGKELLPFTKLVDNFDASYGAVANDDTVFTFRTNKDAPKYKLVRVDLKSPSIWTDVIPQSEKDVLEVALPVNNTQLLICYLRDVKHVLEVRDLETGSLLHHLPLDIGSVDDISAERKDSIVFFRFTSFLAPGIIYQCDLNTDAPEMKIFREIVVPKFDRSEFEVDQVFVPSKDGTKIPMFIVARKGISLDGSHPCILYGYGGFNISITPSFGVTRVVLLKHVGAIYCIANIRGGGEYGEEWHKAGSLAKKQNCFDDFISAGEFLVSNGYTQPKKLCIEGGSNGGLLVGACINQRPDLFGCALAHVGVMDMLRFHKFTVGHAWTSDYGCSDKEKEFQSLIKYSPVHNVRRPWEESSNPMSQYPATMLLTADHDDRVVPLHSLKLLATMQHTLGTSLENSPQKNPIIGRIECKVGHGAGRPTQLQKLIKLPLLVMATNTMLEDSKKRALEAVERRFASEARVQHRQTRDKRIRRDQNPDPENEDPTFARIIQPVHENLLTAVQVSNKDKSTVDKLLHELLRKGDAAQKYIQGTKNVKFDHQINLDNYYKKNSSSVTRLRALQANSKRSKKHMSMKQLKRVGLLDLPEEFHKFEQFISMHEMWKEYVIHLLKNIGKNQVAAVLFGANLHGAIFRVVECKVDSFVGVLGIMIRETAETFGIITKDNKFRVVPKRGSVFVLQADCWRTTLVGDKFVSRKSGL